MPELEHIRVHDAMHHGLLSCAPDAPLADLAAMMAKHRVHAVAISEPGSVRASGIVSDLDLVSAIGARLRPTAEQAAGEPLSVSSDERLDSAAKLMAQHGVSHLVVLDAAGGQPIGMLSTLDVAAVYAADGGG